MNTDRRSTTPRVIPLALMTTLAALTGCTDDAAPPYPEVSLTLVTCLDAPDPNDKGPRIARDVGCRSALVVATKADDTAKTSGCFVARVDDKITRRAMSWSDDNRLVVNDGGRLGLLSGQSVRAAIFFGADLKCDDLEPTTACTSDDGCQVKLGPVTRTIAVSGPTEIDFADDGRCVSEPGAIIIAPTGEPCDGRDNDCDGVIDEAITQPCAVGIGACELNGDALICSNGIRVCADGGERLVPASNRGPDNDCDGTDQDCDGRIDESGGCTDCVVPSECADVQGLPHCVNGACRVCDPSTHAGCDAERPFCDAQDFTCRACDPTTHAGCDALLPFCDAEDFICRACENDAECGPDRVCSFGTCAVCDPTRPETCTAPEQPVCDPDTRTCRGCQGQGRGDCPTGFCFAGRCGPCDPAGHDGCNNPTPICNARDLSCGPCQNDPECSDADATTPICRQGICLTCEPGTNEGCIDPANPICVDGDPPTCEPCDQDDDCPGGSCQEGRCVGCDPATNLGCLPNSELPICDPGPAPPGTAACRACENSPECQNGRICHDDRCVICIDGESTGCDPNSAAPICSRGVCRDCQNDNECIAREGDRDQCVDGRCERCDAVDNAGCDPASALPTCRAGACVACTIDAECLERQCLRGGRCADCDPADHAGCDAAAPICGAGNACRGCNADGECGAGRVCHIEQADRGPEVGQCFQCDPRRDSLASRMIDFGCDAAAPICGAGNVCRTCLDDDECSGGQCVGGQCAQCDPMDGNGCDPALATPICSAARTCVACTAENRCGQLGRAPECNLSDGRCVTCLRVSNDGCEGATPICENFAACRACRAGECAPGLTCEVATGRCRECLPGVLHPAAGACDPTSAEPLCDPITFACTACDNNEECRTLNPNRGYCVEGACLACDPDSHGGCNARSDLPRCDDGTCVGCGDDAFCGILFQSPGGQCLNDGRCGQCDPLDNSGCNPAGRLPVCNALRGICEDCTGGTCSQGDCNPGSGECVRCDPADVGTCVLSQANPNNPALPVCDAVSLACVVCQNADDCADHPYGTVCNDGGLCVCNGQNLRCDLNSNRPVCSGANCRACANNDECIGNPFGTNCILAPAANPGRCRPPPPPP